MVLYMTFLVFFTVTRLSETNDFAVKLILENKKDTEFSENELTKLLRFATCISILMEKSSI